MEQISGLNPIQTEIYTAIKQMSEKATFTEAVLAKKIRGNLKIETKKKAVLSLDDILTALDVLSDENIFYSLHVNSVNDCLFKKESEKIELALESKQRRHKSEKSMDILTSGDIVSKSKDKPKSKIKKSRPQRTVTQDLSIYENYDD